MIEDAKIWFEVNLALIIRITPPLMFQPKERLDGVNREAIF